MKLLQTLSHVFHLAQFVKCLQIFVELNSKRLYRSSGNEKKSRRLGSCSDGKKMYKKRDARAELLFRQSKPIAFLPFSMTSPLSSLKPPIPDHAWKTTLKTRLGQVKYHMLHQNQRSDKVCNKSTHRPYPAWRCLLFPRARKDNVCTLSNSLPRNVLRLLTRVPSRRGRLRDEPKKSILYLSSLCNVIHS